MGHPHYQVTSSDRKTADSVITAIGGFLHSIVLECDGTNAASVILYDNASTNSGLVLAKIMLPASSTVLTYQFTFNNPVTANKGIYADVTGTGAAYTVHFSQGV